MEGKFSNQKQIKITLRARPRIQLNPKPFSANLTVYDQGLLKFYKKGKEDYQNGKTNNE